MDIKIGDKIAYIKYDVSSWNTSQTVDFGYIFYISDEEIGCARYKNSPNYIKRNSEFERYFHVDIEVKANMTDIIQKEIDSLQTKIKSLTLEEKDEIVKKEFNRIKQQIMNTANNMITDKDETYFISRLKTICELKKQLFSIKISDLDNINKSNGVIKCKIKKLKDLLIV